MKYIKQFETDYMRNIKQFENFENDTYVHYELYSVDNNNDEYKMPLRGDDYNYNPYELDDSVKLMEKYQ